MDGLADIGVDPPPLDVYKRQDMARRALRVIGVARRELSLQPRKLESGTVERDLTFLCLLYTSRCV